jgi:hypothetical protein
LLRLLLYGSEGRFCASRSNNVKEKNGKRQQKHGIDFSYAADRIRAFGHALEWGDLPEGDADTY